MVNLNSVEGIESLIDKRTEPLNKKIKELTDLVNKLEAAINYTRCCKSDSEQLFCSDCNVDLKKANGFCPKYIDCEELKTK
jgi:hypothetical protein|tara:strand:+ start:438 stop:680 length:243 start_codon:yes stop_codon:yes gene_type:complete